jgi:hypothetical protein
MLRVIDHTGDSEIIADTSDVERATFQLEQDLARSAASDYSEKVMQWWNTDRDTPLLIANGTQTDIWEWTQ